MSADPPWHDSSAGSDLAIGTRLARGSRVIRGPKRELISRGYNLLLRTLMGARFSDAQCGFKAIRRDQARVLLPLTQDIMSATTSMPRHAADGRPGGRRVPRLLRGPQADPRWARPALAGLLALTAVLYLWDLTRNGWANDFYAAAVQAGTKSWKAFFFGSFDSSNFITVDKTPGSLWVMELSGRVFGLSQWSMLAPQALEGVASVLLLYAAVKRWFGAGAGLVAGLVLALPPVAALMFRFNNPDALLVLLMTAAAYTLALAAVLLGLALVAGLAGPAAYALDTAGSSHTGAIPSAGPAGFGSDGGPGGGGPGGGRVSSALTRLLEQDASKYTWMAATEGSEGAAPLQLATGDAVMAIGGFNGTDPWPTLAVFKELVAKGEIHYYVGQGSQSFAGGRGSSSIESWVAAHFKKVTVGGQTVYDLTQRTS